MVVVLPLPGRRDDLCRPVGERRGGALLGVERAEDRGEVERGGRGDSHAAMVAMTAYQPITGGLPGGPRIIGVPTSRAREEPLSGMNNT